MKGIVMDVKRKYVIVMSNDGGFYRAKKEDAHCVGKEIRFTPLPEKNRLFSISNWKMKISSLAATCTVLGGILFAVIPRAVPVYAYVSVDINPSIEFSVGENWTVIKTTFTNKDGKELLLTLPNLKGEPIETALDQVIEAAKKNGKLQDNGDVWITSVFATQNQTGVPAEDKLNQLQTELETKDKIQIQVGTTTEKIRNDAEKLGISPGKYVYYQNAAKSGTPISLQNLQSDSVTKIESGLHEKNNSTDTTNNLTNNLASDSTDMLINNLTNDTKNHSTDLSTKKASELPAESHKGNEHGSGQESDHRSNPDSQSTKQVENMFDTGNSDTPYRMQPSDRGNNTTDGHNKSEYGDHHED